MAQRAALWGPPSAQDEVYQSSSGVQRNYPFFNTYNGYVTKILQQDVYTFLDNLTTFDFPVDGTLDFIEI
jgi:hypothetical protein